LDGAAKLANVKLPATAALRRSPKDRETPRVLVVQAEIGADGKTTYGIIGGGDIRAATPAELKDITPIKGLEKAGK
jgi:hypothetical protein